MRAAQLVLLLGWKADMGLADMTQESSTLRKNPFRSLSTESFTRLGPGRSYADPGSTEVFKPANADSSPAKESL
jgi:hypothetical protein